MTKVEFVQSVQTKKVNNMRLCYDIETDGFDATVIWCLVAQNMETGNVYRYSDYDDKLPPIKDGVSLLNNAKVLIGHNIIGLTTFKSISSMEPILTQRNATTHGSCHKSYDTDEPTSKVLQDGENT